MYPRRGVATYLQTMILLAVALGGSVAVAGVTQRYAAGSSSQTIQVSGLMVRQGQSFAVESFDVANTGSVSISGLTILNPSMSSSTDYCVSIWDPKGQTLLQTTCPAMAQDPTKIQVALAMQPGKVLDVQIIAAGSSAFSLGVQVQLAVIGSNAAQATAGAEVLAS